MIYRHPLPLIALIGCAAALPAQQSKLIKLDPSADPTLNLGGISYPEIPGSGRANYACDFFNRPDGLIGPDWAEQSGKISVVGGTAASGVRNCWMQHTSVSSSYDSTKIEFDLTGDPFVVSYAAGIAGVGSDMLFTKIQSDGSGFYTSLGIYHGNNVGGFGSYGGFYALSNPVKGGHVTIWHDVDSTYFSIDIDYDGVNDQLHIFPGISSSGLAAQLGNGVGLGAQESSVDNFLLNDGCPPVEGQLVGWGYDGNSLTWNTPPEDDFIDITMGNYHAYGLRADGSIVGWGRDFFNELSDMPVGETYQQVEAFAWGGIGLLLDGSIVAWGRDDQGMVSNVPAGNDFVQIEGGDENAIALRADGTLASWGYNGAFVITDTPTGNDFVYAAMGDFVGHAIKTDGSLVTWGYDLYSQVTNSPSGNDFIKVDASRDNYSAAMRADGSIVMWGRDWYSLVSNAPVGPGWLDFGIGDKNAAAIRADGTMRTWGNGREHVYQNNPQGGNFVEVVAGDSSFCARGSYSSPRLEVRGLDPNNTAYADFSYCTPNSQVYLAFSLVGPGPTATPFGPAMVSAPYQTYLLATDNIGRARYTMPIPPGSDGLLVWAHGLDVTTATFTNALALDVRN